MLELDISHFLNVIPSMPSAALYQVVERAEGVIKSYLDAFRQLSYLLHASREDRIEVARKLMEHFKPKVVELKPGEVKRIDNDLIVEKTTEGEIIIYAVTGE